MFCITDILEDTLFSTIKYERFNHTPSQLAISTYFYVQKCGYILCDPHYYVRREGLDSFLLILTLSGKGHLVYRGKEYEVKKGRAMFIQCSEFHYYYPDKEELWEFQYLHFNGTGVEGYLSNISSIAGPVIHIPDIPALSLHFNTIMALKKHNDLYFEVKCASVISQILTLLTIAGSTATSKRKNSALQEQIEAALKYIENNYAAAISLEDIAAASCLSKYHFTRVFKRVTGYNAYEFLIKLRITKAKSLLSTSNLPVDVIAEKTGFESASHFARVFKSLEGMPPSVYRSLWCSGTI